MKLRETQLGAHLEQQLAPVYLISGDVPLLVQEACDAVRAAARQAGCSERVVMQAERGFDWEALLQAGGDLSLFAQRRLLELRLPSGKPGDAGSKALLRYLQLGSEDNVLLIEAGKIDRGSQKSKWFKAVERAGVVVQIWPPDARQFPAWIRQRMQTRGLAASREAVAVLAERSEGNLLACDQEIEKLRLLYGPGRLDAETVLQSVVDSTRFDVFKLVDSALSGDSARSARILQGLRGEGVEPAVVLWALARELRLLSRMAVDMKDAPLERVLAAHRVWDSRKALFREGLGRHRPANWWVMLARAARIDRIIKGRDLGNVWDELLQLSLMIAGIRTVRAL